MNFRRISSTWKGRRKHNSDIEVWRLLKRTRAARLYWKKNRDAGLFRCKRCLGLLSPWLRTAATPKPGASSQQNPKCRAVCRPRRQALPAAQHPVLFRRVTVPKQNASSGTPSGQGGCTALRTAQGPLLPTGRGFPRTTGLASATPSSCASPPVGASVPTSQALCRAVALPRLWGVPLGFLAPATSLGTHRYSGTPKPGEELDPGGGGRLAKFLQVAPRARREPANLNFMSRASESALHSARTHIYTHTITRLHTLTTSTHPLTHIAHRTRLRTSARSIISWGSTVKLTLLNFLRLFLKFPFYLFFPSQCLPPTPTSRTNLWNPCRVPPVTHNACSSHGQHRRPPKILMFGDPLC